MSSSEAGSNRVEDGEVTRQHWKWTILASMADYLDAASIVAGAAGLALWAQAFGMTTTTVGLLAAVSSNGISAGIGALIGGRLGDLIGRKRVYQYDLLLYALGALVIVFAANLPMLAIGYFLVGIAVGADVPTSWALIAEFSPSRARRKLMGMTNIFWYIGPIVTLLLALVLAPLGLLGIRIIFAHLVLAALITWWLRRGMVESARWSAAAGVGTTNATADPAAQPEQTSVPTNPFARSNLRDLFTGANIRALLFITTVYTMWNLVAGTYGFFFPFILSTLGGQSQAASVGLQALWFGTAMVGVVLIFMQFGDRFNRRLMHGISAALQVIAFLLFVFFPISLLWVVVANVILFGFGHGMAAWPLYRTWSVELFPTMLRATAQGTVFGIARISLGIWSFFVPVLAATGFRSVAVILALMLTYTLVVGTIWAPDTGGKSLEEIEKERSESGATA